MTAGSGDTAYLWGDNRGFLFRVDGTTITQMTVPTEPSGGPTPRDEPINLAGLGADTANGERIRVASTRSAKMYESTDGGQTWSQVGVAPPTPSDPLVYRFAFDPNDIDHVVAGMASHGAYASFDGGASWKKSTGISIAPDGRANFFEVVISPADPNVVWAVGLDVTEEMSDPNLNGRYFYRSGDGGKRFDKAFADSAEVSLRNGQTIAPHPTNPDVVYFEFGTCWGGRGTDLYRWDHATGQISWTNQPVYEDYYAIAFNPADPSVMYIALTSENGHGC